MKNKLARLRSAKKIRSKIALGEKHRLTVYKTTMHTYAQLCSPKGAVIASASTLEKDIVNNKFFLNLAYKLEKYLYDKITKNY